MLLSVFADTDSDLCAREIILLRHKKQSWRFTLQSDV